MPLAHLGRLPGVPRPSQDDAEEMDPNIRLKMDALYALGETREDSVSFRTLRDVAVDKTQPRALRESALDALSNFTHFDVLPVFLDVVKKDTSEEVQNMAIDYIGQISKDKNRLAETLRDLFYAVPRSRTEQLQTILSSIAEVGNDKAVDALAHVARTDNDYDFRSDAIYYLGNIGGERARTVLYEILRGK
jgi:HEAT repeat protein